MLPIFKVCNRQYGFATGVILSMPFNIFRTDPWLSYMYKYNIKYLPCFFFPRLFLSADVVANLNRFVSDFMGIGMDL